ncbi:MAG TPA: NAD-dependent succinate-semialdehyde dehydrogenase [Acidobacteriaceae bacterium]|nr:NAD-dependent succinate-semialdehyde dehydrogenase [Acidobacteriaceae bacterium]
MSTSVVGRKADLLQDQQHPYGSYIAGQWVGTAEQKDVVDPSTAKPFAKVCSIQKEHVSIALEAAEQAFGEWRQVSALERGKMLRRVGDELTRRRQEIARTITLENGKPLAQSEGEVAMSADHLYWFAEEARRVYGRSIPNQVKGKRHLIVKTPIGVVGAIAPWNFPLVLSVRKAAPALAAGCPVILKPASQTPISGIHLAECMEAAGIPPGVFQLVIGNAAMISETLLSSPICRKISFTGSTQVGRLLIRSAAETIKPLCLELGGLAPVLVFDDCDLDIAVRETIIAKFRNTGQSCIAANRIFVQKKIHKEFTERFCAAVSKLRTGPGLEPGMDVGPLINNAAVNAALQQVEDAVSKGARLLAGGKRMANSAGFFLEPTVLDEVPDAAACMCEETFAPVAPLSTFESEDEVLERANSSEYGLSAYAMTSNINRMFRLGERLEAGTIGINDGAPTVSSAPFGGVKQSGWGRELGIEGLEAFLETKHVSIGNFA